MSCAFSDGAFDVTGTTVPEFHGNSYMMLEMKEKVGHSFAFEVWFLAKDLNGKSLIQRCIIIFNNSLRPQVFCHQCFLFFLAYCCLEFKQAI